MSTTLDRRRHRIYAVMASVGLTLGAGALLLATRGGAHAQSASIVPFHFQSGEVIRASQINDNFAALEQALRAAEARVAALEALLGPLTFDASTQTLVLTGVNLQVRNGLAATDQPDGTGNLILGHNEPPASGARTGSHNLVIGAEHAYTSTAGLGVGRGHALEGKGAVALGGEEHRVRADHAVAVGGARNDLGPIGGGPSTSTGRATTAVGAFDASLSTERAINVGARASAAAFGREADAVSVGERAGAADVGQAARGPLRIGAQAERTIEIGAGGHQGILIGPASSVGVTATTIGVTASGALGVTGGAVTVQATNPSAELRLEGTAVRTEAVSGVFVRGDHVAIEATGASPNPMIGSGNLGLSAASLLDQRAAMILIESVGKPVVGSSLQIHSKDQLSLRGADKVLAEAEDSGHTMFLD